MDNLLDRNKFKFVMLINKGLKLERSKWSWEISAYKNFNLLEKSVPCSTFNALMGFTKPPAPLPKIPCPSRLQT